jgi:hypothetical protein
MRPLRERFDEKRTQSQDAMAAERKLAAVLCVEVWLYNEEALQLRAGLGELPERVRKDLLTAYRKFAETVGRSDSARSVFVEAAANRLTGGEHHPIVAVLEPEDSRPQVVRDSLGGRP